MMIRKKFKFEAAHRLLNSFSKRCRGIHGHSYIVELVVNGDVNPRNGMIVDFGLLKMTIGKFIDKFDHALILYSLDPILRAPFTRDTITTAFNPRLIVVPYEPTAEMMAAHFYWQCKTKSGLESVRAVRIHETDTGWAECDEIIAEDFSETWYSLACEVGDK